MVESPWKYGLDARFLPFRDNDAVEATSLREREKAFFDQETAAMKPFRFSKLKKKPARPARKSTTPSPRSHACSRRSPRRGPCHACSKPNQFPRLLLLFQWKKVEEDDHLSSFQFRNKRLTQDVLRWSLWRWRNSRGSRLAQLAVHQKWSVQGFSGQTFYQCNHEGDVNEAMHIQDQASCSRFAQQVEGDDQLRSWNKRILFSFNNWDH